jgi:hypothetical protein
MKNSIKIHVLGASERSAGLRFEEVCRWKLDTPIPVSVRSKLVQVCDPKYFASCDVIFSGLDSSVATEIGMLVIWNLPFSFPFVIVNVLNRRDVHTYILIN